jgi:alkaline phosphatase D
MGLRVGEVTQNSAIVWTKLTRDTVRNNAGEAGPKVVGQIGPRIILSLEQGAMKSDAYEPLDIPTEDMIGACPGTEGETLVMWSEAEGDHSGVSDWRTVFASNDYTHQFRLADLKPATKYNVTIMARPTGAASASATYHASFTTAAADDTWQDVSFGVVTGQGYKDLDHPDGFNIFNHLAALNLNFLCSTGDSIYYDSEEPQARTPELARYHWQRMYSLPRHLKLFQTTPGYWEKDDHDTLSDDIYPAKEPEWMAPMNWATGLKLFREQVPMGDKTYRTIRWGNGLQVWFVENRDFRSNNPEPDGPGKSIWGAKQKAWLKRTLLESDATFKVLVSPTPVVGPDRPNKMDSHANVGFFHEGSTFRAWTQEQKLDNFFVVCGDRHWQYMSVDPKTGLREFSCGPASDKHASGSPGWDKPMQPYHNVQGGFLSVDVSKAGGRPRIAFRFHGTDGAVDYEYRYPQ